VYILSVFMSRFYSVLFLFLLSFPTPVFAQAQPDDPKPSPASPSIVLLRDVLGIVRFEATEFIELTPADFEHINAGLRHYILNEMGALAWIETWQYKPESQDFLDLSKMRKKLQKWVDVEVKGSETSARFIKRLLKIYGLVEEISSTLEKLSRAEPSLGEIAVIQNSVAHILNLLEFSLRVFQKQKASLSPQALESIEVLVELAKKTFVYTRVSFQGALLPAEMNEYLDFFPPQEFFYRFTLLPLFADFVSDPAKQFGKPTLSIQDGRLVILLPYRRPAVLDPREEGIEPWEKKGPGLLAYLFKIFYERHLGARILVTHNPSRLLLEIKIEVPLSGESPPSLGPALSRVGGQLYLNPSDDDGASQAAQCEEILSLGG